MIEGMQIYRTAVIRTAHFHISPRQVSVPLSLYQIVTPIQNYLHIPHLWEHIYLHIWSCVRMKIAARSQKNFTSLVYVLVMCASEF